MQKERPEIFDEIGDLLECRLHRRDRLVPRSQLVRHQINATVIADFGDTPLFIKLNQPHTLEMFEAEFAGLNEIASSNSIRVPEPIMTGRGSDHAFLVLEHLDFGAQQNAEKLGENLAAMHRHASDHYGWERDNTIGLTHQPNPADENWISFWREQRLGYQLQLAAQNGHTGPLQQEGERLLEQLEGLFTGYQPLPSLLHGDLWSGNYGFLESGEPVIYDPAVYYGDRETDLAMTELFGGFSPGFYAAYQHHYPLDEGYNLRKDLYQLYHVLNHLNLFGSGYLGQAIMLSKNLNARLT